MDEDLYLTELIDVDVLQTLQDSFSKMTGMAALTTDEFGTPVTIGSNFTDFCMKYIRESPLGNSRCMRCDKTGAELSSSLSCQARSYYCHAGLMDFAAPIMVGDRMVGSFIGGQVLPGQPNFDEFRRIANELGIEPEAFIEAAKKVKIVKKDYIDKAAEFLSVVASALSYLAFQSYELRKSNREIEKSSQQKSDFLANMSHEIRTPMNAVLGMVDLALRENMSDAAKEYMHQIKAAAKNLLVIINDILDFSKIESGKMDIINVAYEPFSIVSDLSSIANSRIGTKSIEFTIDVDPNMPQMIFGDNIRLHQILLNLITNGIKFTQQGEVRLSISYIPDPKDDEYVIMKAAVADTGIGIKKSDYERLFNSFQQVDSKRNRNVEGTGLGLAITKQLLSLMDGKISVKSEYGRGSVFFFEVPQKAIDKTPAVGEITEIYHVGIVVSNIYVRNQLVRDLNKINAKIEILNNIENFGNFDYDYLIIEKAFYTDTIKHYLETNSDKKCIVVGSYDCPNDIDLPNVKLVHKPVYALSLYSAMGISDFNTSSSESDENSSFTFIAPDARILIVDDNAVNLTVAKGLIEPLNMNVDTALSASDAIQMVSKTKYDVIFMDHMMPEVDGVEATHIIRRMFPSYVETPIIALTANAVGGAKEMFLSEGMSDFVAKPIEVKEIVSKLRKWLPQDKILPADSINSQPNAEAEPQADLTQIPGLNTEKAISMLGSEKLFATVLKEYYSAIKNNAESIRNHRFKEEWDQYTIEVHALKSTSRQIGAEELGDLAYEMEMAGKNGNIPLIEEKTDLLLDRYLKLKDVLEPYFPDVYEEAEDEEEYADSVIVNEYINKMRAALDEYDILQIEEIIEEMNKYKYHETCIRHFDELKKFVAESDLDGCHETLDKWEECTNHCELFSEVPNEVIFEMLDTLQNALNNFDTLQIDESVEALSKNKYPDAQQELLEQLKEFAKISDIDSCCDIVSKWHALLL